MSEHQAIREATQLPIISTISANCRDCYRCVRCCPVKAIRVQDGQAHVEDELCIKCGTCVRECPQHAKTVLGSLDEVRQLLTEQRAVAASIAPSFAAYFSDWQAGRLPAALRMLGFSQVLETAEGAKRISDDSLKDLDRAKICTACPAVVNYIEKYRPEALDLLIPVVSPMVAHGRMIKQKYGNDCAVVFIGPCIAKKAEMRRAENRDAVDAVLTFDELSQWLTEAEVELSKCPESGFDQTGLFAGSLDRARLFPLEGGMLATCNIDTDLADEKSLCLSGAAVIRELFATGTEDLPYRMIEPLFCAGGCINGPCFSGESSIFARRRQVVEHAERCRALALPRPVATGAHEIDTAAHFKADDGSQLGEVTEDQISHILSQTGKGNPELQINCGACGYNTCRDKAIAVARGMAEPEMCLPHMRRLSRQRTDKIIQTSPNGIVILDRNLNIIHMNEAFHKMFICNDNILGRRISYLLNAEGYEKLALGECEKHETIKVKYGVKYHEIGYVLPEDEQYVGIYIDLSQSNIDRRDLSLIKQQSLEHAKELLDQQITFSQEMAHQLGKNMAHNEELVKRLMELYEEQS